MDNWERVIVALEYLLQFQKDPARDVAAVVRTIMEQRSLPYSPSVVLTALRCAQTSNKNLAELLPKQPHSDRLLRKVFSAIRERLEARRAAV